MSCTVSFRDEHDVEHTATVMASSLYEAVGLAVQAFKRQPWTPAVPVGAPLYVEARQPAVRHQVTLLRARQWAGGTALSPADRLQRERVRKLLAT